MANNKPIKVAIVGDAGAGCRERAAELLTFGVALAKLGDPTQPGGGVRDAMRRLEASTQRIDLPSAAYMRDVARQAQKTKRKRKRKRKRAGNNRKSTRGRAVQRIEYTERTVNQCGSIVEVTRIKIIKHGNS